MTTYDETVGMCALNKIFGYHPALGMKLLQKTGSAVALFDGKWETPGQAGGDVWTGPLGGDVMPGPDRASHPELFAQLVPSTLEWAARELDKVRAGGFRFLSFLDDDYPEPLRECPDPPIGLYLNGTSSPAEIFQMHPMVAFVGTRDLSPYGKAWCEKLVKALAEARVQPCIVSGLALGADGVAHRTALECGLPTIGVMATGIEKVYPYQHERLAMDIVRSPGGALITDYPTDTSPVALNFVRRNRIIAGLVAAVVVVESKNKGGSLMTAKYAVNCNREVFAVPGRLEDIRSAGCNSLIYNQMAQIITDPEQLAEDLGLGGRHRGQGGSWVTSQAGDPPEKVLQAVLTRKYGPGSALIPVALAVQARRGITPEELTASLHRPYGEILSAIGTLEADGFLTTDLLRRCTLI